MRLIDADALRESIITRQTEMSYEDAWALTCVDNAPAIEPDWTELMVICDNCGHTIHVKRIDVKPTIEPQKWIPCSERLPEETVKVLVQADDMYYNMNNDTGILIGWRNGNKWSTLTTKGWESIRYPIAWMPLPKPYEKRE